MRSETSLAEPLSEERVVRSVANPPFGGGCPFQGLGPLLWVWAVEMKIIDYKLNESDISLHNCCY